MLSAAARNFFSIGDESHTVILNRKFQNSKTEIRNVLFGKEATFGLKARDLGS